MTSPVAFLLASSQAMAPRPSMGVPAPRAMPPYKYATGVRNPNPQVVQPALQQVRQKNKTKLSYLSIILMPQTEWWSVSGLNFLPVVFIWSPQAQPAVHVQGQEPLTASMLAAAPPQEQKQMLGELCRTTTSKRNVVLMDVAYFLSIFLRHSQVSVSSRWFSPCMPTWQGRLLACCWRLTTQSCCTCWSLMNLCAQRYLKQKQVQSISVECLQQEEVEGFPQGKKTLGRVDHIGFNSSPVRFHDEHEIKLQCLHVGLEGCGVG